MKRKLELFVSLPGYLKEFRLVMKLVTMLLMVGTIHISAVAVGAVSPDDPQQKTVTGRITDATGAGLPGVNILEKGTINGAISDIDGNYVLTVGSAESVLAFSFIGYTSQEITVGPQAIINVVLAEAVSALDEIVVVGYTTQVRKSLSGSVSTVSSEQLTVSTAPTAMTRLQGQASGVTVTAANTPGGDATIRIRGVGTINDPDPLYIIDGVPSSPGNNISPNDIESISILKDAASSAIYGSRGANGVVIITTKRGRTNQQPNIEFNVRTGVSKAINKYDLLNTSEYAEAVWLSYTNRGVAPTHAQYGTGANPVIPDYILPAGAMEGNPSVNPDLYRYPDYQIYKANKTGTDWYDEIYRSGVVQEYDLSVRGGGQNATYSFSGNYLDENGTLEYTNFKRWTFRMNSDAKFNDWFKAGQSLQGVYIHQNGDLGDNGEGTNISNAYRAQPIIPVYDIMGNFAGSRAPEMGNAGNPVASLYRSRNNTGKWVRVLGNFFGEVTLMKGLTAKTLLGYNYGQWNYKGYTIPNYEHSEPNKVNGMNIDTNNSLQWNWTNTLNYIGTFGSMHKINIVLGTEAIENIYENAGASRSQYFSEDPAYMQLNSGEINKDNFGSGSEWSLFSYFGRVNYDLMGKYLVEATFRRDGSSRFGPEHRYGTFPAASVAWTMSEEGFMAGTRNWLDFLKFRTGWGLSGNDRIGNYNSYSTYATDKYTAAYALDGSNTAAISGFAPSTLGNANVGWETTETINAGIDAIFFKNKLSFSLDVWSRNTRDMLYQLSVPEVMGLATPPYVNIGEMKNKGFDLELGYKNQALEGKFSYAIKATVSRYVNEIVKLSDDVEEEIISGGLRQMNYTRATVGTSFPEFYGYEVEGIFQTPAEAAAHPAYGSTTYNAPGHFKFKNQLTIDSDGDGVMDEADDIIDPNDMTYIGNPHPDFTGGLNVDLAYGNIDFNMFLYGSYGNDMINYVSRWIDYGMFNGGLSKDALYKSWGSPHLANAADARLPMLDQSDVSQQPSTAFVEDGSFLRLKTLRLGFTFPKTLLDRIQVKSLRVYAQMTNVFTLTKYSGLDPELNSSGSDMGLDQGAWPTPRQIMFGINLGL